MLVLITVSQKETTVLPLPFFLACSFWLSALPSASLPGDFGAKKLPHPVLQFLNLDLLLHQRRIQLLSLSQVQMAQSEQKKNAMKMEKEALGITCN